MPPMRTAADLPSGSPWLALAEQRLHRVGADRDHLDVGIDRATRTTGRPCLRFAGQPRSDTGVVAGANGHRVPDHAERRRW